MKFSDFDPAIAAPFVSSFEGCSLTAYRCAAGVLTIGYGHTEGVSETMQITQMEADALLADDLRLFASKIAPIVKPEVTKGQFVALVSFAFNVGIGNFRRSSVLKNLNRGAITAAADAFLLWNRAGGKVLNGLNRRRRAERRLFLGETTP